MIRILNKLSSSLVQFPRNLGVIYSDYEITLKSGDNIEHTFEVEDENTLVDFYQFTMDVSELPDGEYKYVIKHDDVFLGSGLLSIGEIAEELKINDTTETIKYYE